MSAPNTSNNISDLPIEQSPKLKDGGGATKEHLDAITRSAMELALKATVTANKALYATPALFLTVVNKGHSISSACGFRDGSRSLDMDDKGNYLRLKDPVSLSLATPAITSYLCLQLHAEKRISLDAPVSSLDGNLGAPSTVTLRALLNNQAGIRDRRVLRGLGLPWYTSPRSSTNAQIFQNLQSKIPNGEALLKHFAESKIPLTLRPPTKTLSMTPSVFGTALAAALVEKTLSRSFEALMQDRVFKPLSVDTCGLGNPAPKEAHNSQLFYQTSGAPKGHWRKTVLAAEIPMPTVLLPSLGVYGNSSDLATLLYKAWHTIAAEAFANAPPEGISRLHAEACLGTVVLRSQNIVTCYAPLFAAVPYPHTTSFLFCRDRDIGAVCTAICGNTTSSVVARMGCKSGLKVFTDYVAKESAKDGPDGDRESMLNPRDKGILLNFIGKKTSPERF